MLSWSIGMSELDERPISNVRLAERRALAELGAVDDDEAGAIGARGDLTEARDVDRGDAFEAGLRLLLSPRSNGARFGRTYAGVFRVHVRRSYRVAGFTSGNATLAVREGHRDVRHPVRLARAAGAAREAPPSREGRVTRDREVEEVVDAVEPDADLPAGEPHPEAVVRGVANVRDPMRVKGNGLCEAWRTARKGTAGSFVFTNVSMTTA